MNDLERQLKEALQRESAKAPLLEDLPKPVRTRTRRRRAGQTTGGALLSVVLLAGIALPLRAMWPLADHDKEGRFGAGVASAPAIVYERLTDNDFDLMLWSQDGQTRPLVAAPGFQGYPSWSPDGARVAYVAETEPKSDLTQVAIVDLATGAITKVTPPSDSMDDGPAWSPDGNRLAFYRIVTEGSDPPGIYVVNADGTGLRSLTDQAGDARPTWSPDGRSILFDRSINDSTDLWTLDVSTGLATQLTHSDAINGPMGGQYSPDGTQIAYSVVTVDRANLVQRDPVFVIPADRPTAARQVAVTVPGGRFDWTPDGRHLIVAAPDPSREPSGSHQPAEFTAVDINTGETTPLGVQVDYAGGRLDWNPQVSFELSTRDQSPAPAPTPSSERSTVQPSSDSPWPPAPPITAEMLGLPNDWDGLTGQALADHLNLEQTSGSEGCYAWTKVQGDMGWCINHGDDYSEAMIEALIVLLRGESFDDPLWQGRLAYAMIQDAKQAGDDARAAELNWWYEERPRLVPDGGTLPKPATIIPAVPGEDTYVFSNITFTYPYVPGDVTGATADPGFASLTFESDWSGTTYPGSAECQISLLSAEGMYVGGLDSGWSQLTSHISTTSPGITNQIFPVSGFPVHATGVCSAGVKPVEGVTLEGLRLDRIDGRLMAIAILRSPAPVPPGPGTQVCEITGTSPDGMKLTGGPDGTLDVPDGTTIRIGLPDSFQGATDLQGICHPFTGEGG